MTVFWVLPSGMPIKFSLNSVTLTPVLIAKNVIDRNKLIEMSPSINKVVAAFLLFGFLKAGTPFEIAYTPVKALHPEEKARAKRKSSAIPAKDVCETISQSALSARKTSP